MENEILKEVWKAKDEIVQEHDNDIDSLVKELRKKEELEKENVVDLSHGDRDAA
jgi:ATP-dependent Zn protease